MIRRIDITPADLEKPELRLYNETSEIQLRHCYEPEPGCFIAESLRVIERALAAGYRPESLLIEEKHLDEPLVRECGDVPVYVGSAETLSTLAGYKLTGGALCLMRRGPLPLPSEVIRDARHIVVLEGINNPTNVGAIFRSAAALGADALFLTPDCSDPLYRRAARVSMGTVFSLPWTYFGANGLADVSALRQAGFATAAMALTDDACPLDKLPEEMRGRLALLLGNENEGLSEATIAACDRTLIIPMQRGVDSLNVAAASAVACWELFGRT